MTVTKRVSWWYDGFKLDYDPIEDSITVVAKDDGFVVGYLTRDEFPGEWNDGDGIGDIYIGSRYYASYKKYLETLGYDRYGDRDEDFVLDPDVVILSVYDHSGVTLSLLGEGMQCQWDTANGGAVWVPDKCLIEEVQSLSPDERREKMVEFARQAIETWNAYERGDVWGIIIHEYDDDKEMVENGSGCWGFVGYKYAIEELESCLKSDTDKENL